MSSGKDDAMISDAPVVMEQATVYRARGGRRYFTFNAALKHYAHAKFCAKHPCECERGNYTDGFADYTCGIHDVFDRVMPRYLRLLRKKVQR